MEAIECRLAAAVKCNNLYGEYFRTANAVTRPRTLTNFFMGEINVKLNRMSMMKTTQLIQ